MVREGVSPVVGGSEPARPTLLRNVGSLEPPVEGVTADTDRCVLGVRAYGLGVVRLMGLKL